MILMKIIEVIKIEFSESYFFNKNTLILYKISIKLKNCIIATSFQRFNLQFNKKFTKNTVIKYTESTIKKII